MKSKTCKILLITSLIVSNALFIFKLYWTPEEMLVKNDLKRSNDEKSLNFIYKLKNILGDEATLNVTKRQVFFVETNLQKERSLESAKQACSVESVARMNVDYQIYFLFGTDSDGVNMQISDLVEALLSYPNIKLRYFNPKEFSKGTILENFFERKEFEKSKYPVSHLSDIMRALTLYKYGGQYLDLDLINLVPLSVINEPNFACVEDTEFVVPGIMALDTDESVGRKISKHHLESLDKNFIPEKWGGNGPLKFTEAVKNFCNVTKFNPQNGTDCGKFKALPTGKCYPILYGEWRALYQEVYTGGVYLKMKQAGAYFLHMWNGMTNFEKSTYELKYDSKAAYTELAKLYCPKTYETIRKFF